MGKVTHMSKLVFLFVYLLVCFVPLETCTSIEAFLSLGDCLRRCFPGAPALYLTEGGAGS